ncbi:MAG: hypothetical protein F6K31_20395 [Symploca sp. SIO2G7]|nr:hypothetical protein [Symploca sp. SIO2G7]
MSTCIPQVYLGIFHEDAGLGEPINAKTRDKTRPKNDWNRCLARLPYLCSQTLFILTNPQFPIPNSQFPIPDSQFPIPNPQFPIPEGQMTNDK